ncbi:hypothetical protein YIM_07300 [Amycolatopsis sp. YIM 10]|nr:hypothetical protein YIM_07300 [Amycolatopsis sp. YIM 10]
MSYNWPSLLAVVTVVLLWQRYGRRTPRRSGSMILPRWCGAVMGAVALTRCAQFLPGGPDARQVSARIRITVPGMAIVLVLGPPAGAQGAE